MQHQVSTGQNARLSFDEFKNEVLQDYRIAVASREASLIGRREVLTGKAKFGIFGDGKELAQLAAAKFMLPGDIRSGYYRDQTMAFASGICTIQEFFAQLYAHTDIQEEPASGGRMMNGHFGTRWVDENGDWKDLMQGVQSSSDISCTAGQMVRALGFAFASKCFRNVRSLRQGFEKFTSKGNEVVFCTIGDAATSEGHFWETVNAAGVLQVPLAIFVWDDGYGISVPTQYQTTKESVSQALAGFQKEKNTNGVNIYAVNGWDYPALVSTFQEGISHAREHHVPVVFHVKELTQPQGHSTSGSHERYKGKERLQWEKDHDCNVKMREFILQNAIANDEALLLLEEQAREEAKVAKQTAWEKFSETMHVRVEQIVRLCNNIVNEGNEHAQQIAGLVQSLTSVREPIFKDMLQTMFRILKLCKGQDTEAVTALRSYQKEMQDDMDDKYNAHLYSQSPYSPLKVPEVKPVYTAESPVMNGYEVLNRFFDQLFEHNKHVFAFGEDLGMIGDVNQGFAGLQEKHGTDRIFDTGIREATIMGQGIGMAMRGLRPIAEVQYVDYMLYALQTLSDDLACLHYRTRGGQKAPLIVRTRGHRLEGVWHSGSPMAMMLSTLKGIHLCVPRNMTQAAGIYNTLLKGDDPAIVVEVLNGYRLKETLPENLGEFTVPLGVPDVIKEGTDITIVSYGATLRIAQEAITEYLEPAGISCELIDVQTLMPFDINNLILASLKKTNRILFVDEDMPGGTTAYMFQQVMELQGGYKWLDVAPRTVSAMPHRPAYGTDGDYFSKPNAEQIAAVVEEMMGE